MWALYSKIVVTADGKHAYGVSCTQGNVSLIDTATNTIAVTVPIPYQTIETIEDILSRFHRVEEFLTSFHFGFPCIGPVSVAFAPDGKHVNVFGSGARVIDTATNTVVATVEKGAGPTGAGINPPPAEPIPSQHRSSSRPAPP